MKDDLFISTPKIGRIASIGARTPMMNGAIKVPVNMVKDIMNSGAMVYEHNPSNLSEKIELNEENIESPLEEIFPGNVKSAEELIAAAGKEEVTSINLTANIELSQKVEFNRTVNFNGNGFEITLNGEEHSLLFKKSSRLKNITIKGKNSDKSKSAVSNGIELSNGDFVLENISINDLNKGIFATSSNITFVGSLNLSGNSFAGCSLEIGTQPQDRKNASITLMKDCIIKNSSETFESPTFIISTNKPESIKIYGDGNLYQYIDDSKIHYYIKKKNSIKPAEKVLPTINVSIPSEIKVNEPTEFSVSTTAGDYEGGNVKGKFQITSGSELISKKEYYETSGDAGWKDLSGDSFGPPDGFPLMDTTSKFRITCNSSGSLAFTAKIVQVDGDTLVCETTASSTIKGDELVTANEQSDRLEDLKDSKNRKRR